MPRDPIYSVHHLVPVVEAQKDGDFRYKNILLKEEVKMTRVAPLEMNEFGVTWKNETGTEVTVPWHRIVKIENHP